MTHTVFLEQLMNVALGPHGGFGNQYLVQILFPQSFLKPQLISIIRGSTYPGMTHDDR